MTDVTGPISSMPGSYHQLPRGAKCDIHHDRPAVARVQGETDSMGSEMCDMCQQCLDEHRQAVANADTSGVCDWCKKHAPKLRSRRDYEEGMSGRIYDVCDRCIDRENERIAEEEAYYDGFY